MSRRAIRFPVRRRTVGRHDRILKYADLESFGIEIAPFYNPLVPKADGRNVLILDVFETAELRRRPSRKG